jgi:hypothetical protein
LSKSAAAVATAAEGDGGDSKLVTALTTPLTTLPLPPLLPLPWWCGGGAVGWRQTPLPVLFLEDTGGDELYRERCVLEVIMETSMLDVAAELQSSGSSNS